MALKPPSDDCNLPHPMIIKAEQTDEYTIRAYFSDSLYVELRWDSDEYDMVDLAIFLSRAVTSMFKGLHLEEDDARILLDSALRDGYSSTGRLPTSEN